MPTYKTTWMFNDKQQLMGWSESWYITAASKQIAHANSLQVANKRLIAISGGNLLTAVRTTGNVPPGPAGVIRARDVLIDFPGWPGQAGNSFGGDERVQIAAKTRYSNNTLEQFCVRLLRGLPDDGWRDGDDKIAKTLVLQMNLQMVPLMQALSFGFRHKDRSTPPITTFPVVEKGDYESLAIKKTGRPFGLQRGRVFASRTP